MFGGYQVNVVILLYLVGLMWKKKAK